MVMPDILNSQGDYNTCKRVALANRPATKTKCSSSTISSQRDLRDIYVIERPTGKSWKHMSKQTKLYYPGLLIASQP